MQFTRHEMPINIKIEKWLTVMGNRSDFCQTFSMICVAFYHFQSECATIILWFISLPFWCRRRPKKKKIVLRRLLYLDFKREIASVAKIPSIMNEFFLASYQVKAHTNFPAFVARSIAIKRNHNAASLNELHINVWNAFPATLFLREGKRC